VPPCGQIIIRLGDGDNRMGGSQLLQVEEASYPLREQLRSPFPASPSDNPFHIRRPPVAAQNARSGRNAPRDGGPVHRLSQDENRGWCRPAPPWCLAMQTETNGVTMVCRSEFLCGSNVKLKGTGLRADLRRCAPGLRLNLLSVVDDG
jgi:hypothetical protein